MKQNPRNWGIYNDFNWVSESECFESKEEAIDAGEGLNLQGILRSPIQAGFAPGPPPNPKLEEQHHLQHLKHLILIQYLVPSTTDNTIVIVIRRPMMITVL
ncbi:hypothetical protein AKJ16_DCAP27225 [Drosera capensis]